jgi:hypothetical protein
MHNFVRLRAMALAGLLTVSPVLPLAAEPAPARPAVAAAEALFAQVESRPTKSASEFDPAAFNTALGGATKLTYAAVARDPATGATRLTDVRFDLLGDDPRLLFKAKEMLVWGADTPGMIARFGGKNLDRTIRLFDRLELTGVELPTDDTSNVLRDAFTGELLDTGETQVLSGKMTVGRFVMGGVTLHPWTHKEVKGEEEGIAAVRLVSAMARNISVESIAFYDTQTEETVLEGGTRAEMSAFYDRQILIGYDRGNLARSASTGTTFTFDMNMPATAATATEAATPAMKTKITGAAAYSDMSGFRFAKLLEYGERGEMPPITERDLWSIGTFSVSDAHMAFDGKRLLEVGQFDMNMDKFAWFIPERISFAHKDASLNIADMIAWADSIEPLDEAGDTGPTVKEILAMLERTGLTKLSGDGNFALTWDSQTGTTRLESNGQTDDLYADETRFEIHLPSYAQLIPAFGKDGKTPDDKALTALFEKEFKLVGGHFAVTDGGLLDKLSLLTIEVAKMDAGKDPMLATFADSTPETVRSFASGIIMLASSEFSAELPQASKWIIGLSQFISKGGTFSVKLAPEKPLTIADFDAIETGDEMSPKAMVDLFGLSMTHTPAAETAAGSP